MAFFPRGSVSVIVLCHTRQAHLGLHQNPYIMCTFQLLIFDSKFDSKFDSVVCVFLEKTE
jgi:hypothetical protein